MSIYSEIASVMHRLGYKTPIEGNRLEAELPKVLNALLDLEKRLEELSADNKRLFFSRITNSKSESNNE